MKKKSEMDSVDKDKLKRLCILNNELEGLKEEIRELKDHFKSSYKDGSKLSITGYNCFISERSSNRLSTALIKEKYSNEDLKDCFKVSKSTYFTIKKSDAKDVKKRGKSNIVPMIVGLTFKSPK